MFHRFQFETLPSSVAGAQVILRRLSRSLTSLGRPGPPTAAGAGGLVTDGIPHIDSSNSLDSRIKHETVSINALLYRNGAVRPARKVNFFRDCFVKKDCGEAQSIVDILLEMDAELIFQHTNAIAEAAPFK